MPNKPRTPLSLAIERQLHSMRVSGVTDAQIADASDMMAAVIEKSHMNDADLNALYVGDDPATRKFAFYKIEDDNLNHAFTQCFPPRMVTPGDSMQPIPLPPREWKAPETSQWRPGMLEREYLWKLSDAFADAGRSHHNPFDSEPYYPAAEFEKVSPPLSGDTQVLKAVYEGDNPGSETNYYFWYQKLPDGLEAVLKKLPSNFPLFDFGAPVTEAPESEPEDLKLLAQKAGEAHAPQEPLPAPADFGSNMDAVNSGRSVPRNQILVNEDAVLTGQNAMCVSAKVDMRYLAAVDCKADLEASLREAGISVLPLTKGSYPRLVLSIDTQSGTVSTGYQVQDYLVVSADLSFKRLYQNNVHGRPEKYIEGTVWKTAFYGTALHASEVRAAIKSQLINEFIRAYKSANNLP